MVLRWTSAREGRIDKQWAMQFKVILGFISPTSDPSKKQYLAILSVLDDLSKLGLILDFIFPNVSVGGKQKKTKELSSASL